MTGFLNKFQKSGLSGSFFQLLQGSKFFFAGFPVFFIGTWLFFCQEPVGAEPVSLELKATLSPATGMRFLKIPGGCFLMGSDAGFFYEQPVHEVCVDEFFLGKFEVTQKEWRTLMDSNPSKFVGDDHPVDRVSWNDAHAFIEKLNASEKTGRYRLPTEAEWEYAARAGTTTTYYWGDEVDNDFVWYYGTSDFSTHPVGTKKPNGFGLYDMLGNVWEWVSDWYANDYFKNSPRNNPQGPESGKFKVRRGGSSANLVSHIRSSTRYRGKLDHRHHILGFRVAFSVPGNESEGSN